MSKVSCEHYLIPVRKVEDCIFCQDLSRSNFSLVLDAANAPWLLNDVALLSTKTGEQLLLTLLYDGRRLQLLEIHCSFWVVNWEIVCLCNSVVDQEHQPCHLVLRKRSSSDALQDMVGGEELSLYGSAPNNTESAQKTFLFAVRDLLTNVGPLKDFSYGLRIHADASATGIAKQSNYELVEPTGSKGIRTVCHKRTCSHSADLPPALYQFCHDGLYLLQNDTIQKLL
ncbi:hypothetical protein POUND7_007089 [Theobroma cacao]